MSLDKYDETVEPEYTHEAQVIDNDLGYEIKAFRWYNESTVERLAVEWSYLAMKPGKYTIKIIEL